MADERQARDSWTHVYSQLGEIRGELRGIRSTIDDRSVSRDKIDDRLNKIEVLVNTTQMQMNELQKLAQGSMDKSGSGILAELTDFRVVLIIMGIGALLGKPALEQLSGLLN